METAAQGSKMEMPGRPRRNRRASVEPTRKGGGTSSAIQKLFKRETFRDPNALIFRRAACIHNNEF
jgi:hypothetical protein